MSSYFSTQESIEARVSALRLKGWIDRDGNDAPDADALLAGFKFARGVIRGRLEGRFGYTEIASWTSETAPELVRAISDDLCIYQFFLANPALHTIIEPLYTQAIEMLTQIAGGELSLFGVDAPVDDECLTERVASDFDPERELDDMTVRATWTLPDARELDGY